MDRRRFVPTAQGLDPRVLLSTASPKANLHQKTIHIENLPAALASIQPGRVVPKEIVTRLQTDLLALVGKLLPPPQATLRAATAQYKAVLADASVSVEDAAGLRATFRNALEGAAAPQATVDSLVATMDQLIQVDSTGKSPTELAANDYAFVLQTALGVGRPIRPPGAPTLAPGDNDGPKNDRATTVVQPHLTGRYDTSSTIQLLDESNTVIGAATVQKSGQYSVAPIAPLSVGKHTLRVRAFDFNGNSSPPGRTITITINPPRAAKPPRLAG